MECANVFDCNHCLSSYSIQIDSGISIQTTLKDVDNVRFTAIELCYTKNEKTIHRNNNNDNNENNNNMKTMNIEICVT